MALVERLERRVIDDAILDLRDLSRGLELGDDDRPRWPVKPLVHAANILLSLPIFRVKSERVQFPRRAACAFLMFSSQARSCADVGLSVSGTFGPRFGLKPVATDV